jgi:DNA-binding winged helix-turn-helix (wHTH) protein/tetratricopeptide (TPR) repeat protein
MAPAVFQFGDCSINIASRELLRAGERVSLSPIVFDCIAYLIQHRERAVGRDELVAAVWGRASVSDAVMGKTILTARRAIGDTAEEQRFLRTVPRFGYQWGAPTRSAAEVATAPQGPIVMPMPAPVHPVPASGDATGRTRASKIWPKAAWAAALALLFALAIGAAWWRHAPRSEPAMTATAPAASASPADMTIVLPVDVAATPEDDWLRLGLMDLIAARLRASGLAVLPSDSVVRLVPAGSARDAAIAAVRGVGERSHVIAAAVRHSGADWMVRAELVEPDGSTHAVQSQTDNAITAAGRAADALLELLGKHAPSEAMNAARLSQTELLQRVDAARLAGDPAQARALIAAADPALQAQPEVQLRLAQIDLRTGAFEASRARLAHLATQVTEETDASLHARIQSYLCIALARVGQLEAGERACDRAIGLLETRNQPAELGRVYSDRAIVRKLQEHYDAAAQDNARARIALTLAGDALQLAKVDGNESVMDMALGRYGEAVSVQRRIEQTFRRFGMNNERVVSLNNQAAAHLALLQPLDALERSDEAIAVLDRVTDASIRYATTLQRADALRHNGRLGEARVLLDELIAQTSGDESAVEQAVARAMEARLDLDTGQPAAALLLARQCILVRPAPTYDDVRAQAWLTVVRSLDRLGRGEAAAAALKSFGAWAPTDNPEVQLTLQLAMAERAAVERDPAARDRYAAALAQATRWAVPAPLADTVVSYGLYLIAQGDLPQASSVIGMVSRYADRDFDAAVLQAQLYHALGNEAAAQAATEQAHRLAGERSLPRELVTPAGDARAHDRRTEATTAAR